MTKKKKVNADKKENKFKFLTGYQSSSLDS